LKEVIVPQSVTIIVPWTFANCDSLTTVIIPDSVTRIGGYAFIGSNNIKDIYFAGTEEQWKSCLPANDSIDLVSTATIHYNSTGPDEASISLDKSSIRLTEIGATEALTAIVQPVGAEVTWSTSDVNVATVDNGIITAVGVDSATIFASISIGSNTLYSRCVVTIALPTASDLYIVEQVKKYTTDTLFAQAQDIFFSQESDTVKMQRFHELFTLYDFTDMKEGTKYLCEALPKRRAYIALTTDDMYVAYQTWNYLNNTPAGILSRQLLQVDGLGFNGELNAYIDPLTLLDLSNLPDVKKYKDVLYEFMDAQMQEIEVMNYISWVSKLVAQNADEVRLCLKNKQQWSKVTK